MSDELPKSDPRKPGFTPEVLDKTIISIPLLRQLDDPEKGPLHAVVIDLNLDFVDGRAAARKETIRLINQAKDTVGKDPSQGVDLEKSEFSDQYVFARL